MILKFTNTVLKLDNNFSLSKIDSPVTPSVTIELLNSNKYIMVKFKTLESQTEFYEKLSLLLQNNNEIENKTLDFSDNFGIINVAVR